MESSQLTASVQIIRTRFKTQMSKTFGGLSSLRMLLGELNSQSLVDFLNISKDSSEEAATSIHDDETEPFIVVEDIVKRLGVESGLALVGVDEHGSERLNVEADLLFSLSAFLLNDTSEDTESIIRYKSVKLQFLNGGLEGGLNRLARCLTFNASGTRQFLT